MQNAYRKTNRISASKALLFLGVLLFGMSTGGFAISFNNGSPQSLSVCFNSATSINSLLTATDATGLTFTWTVTSGPSNGTIIGLPQTAASGTNIAPVAVSYTPFAGTYGADAFTVQVSDGVTSVTTVINVIVNPVPTISLVSPNFANPLSGVTITGTNFNTTPGNNIVYFGTTRAAVTAASATSLSVNVPNGGIFAPITVENNSCAIDGNYNKPFLPTFNNTAYAPQTVNFATHVDITTTSSSNHLTYGDIDGDGKVDVIESNFGTSTVYVYRNTSTTGSPSFSLAATLPLAAGGAGSATIGDIDGDGLLDIVVAAAAGGGNVYIYRNTSTPGSISFAGAVTVSYFTNANISAIADIDGDGLPDIISSELSNLAIFRNTSTVGSISFAARVNFTAPANISGVATGDLDGDGKTDVMVSNSTTSVSAWRNISTPGTISFGGRQDFTTPGSATNIAMADIDGDGIMDIVCTSTTPNDLSVFKGTSVSGTISMGARSDFATGANDQYLTIGDFDGDGKPDVAVSSITSSNVGVFRNSSVSGTVSFASRADFAANSGASQLGAVDIDGDGLTDIVVTDQSTTKFSVLLNSPLSPNTGTATVCPGLTTTLSNSFAGGGTWSSGSPTIASVVAGTGVVTGILEGGTANITFTTTGTAQTVVTTVTVTATPTITAITSPSPAIGFPASSVTLSGTNFNTTSTNDIVWFGSTRATVTSAGATSLTVTVPLGGTFGPITVENSTCGLQAVSYGFFLQDYSNGSFIANIVNFDPRVDFTAGTQPAGVAIGDFDGDGKPDIVVSDFGSSQVRVFLNISSSGSISASSFAAPIILTNPSPDVLNVAVGDMDGDGKLDIITACVLGGSNKIAVFRNTSSLGSLSFAGSFTVATSGSTFNSLSIADIDGDGKPEIIATLSNVMVYQNNSVPGTLNFGGGSSFASFSTPVSLAEFDVDGDGKKDIVAANNGSGNVSVLRNTSTPGSISFAAHVDFSVGTGPNDAVGADIDGDGLLDIIAANSTANTISVLRNISTIGTPNFATQVTFPTGTFPDLIGIGDADGDGKPDIYVTNQSASTISVLRNTATSGSIVAGSLAAKVDFAVTSSAFGLAVGDLDGDGKADVITSPGFSGTTISVLRNDPLTPITGTFTVCQNGPTTTLSDVPPGGTWTSSNANATIGATTGVLAGITGGTATITYQGTATSLTLGNYTTQLITINPQSSAAFTSGTNPTCQGAGFTSLFNNASAGITAYAWSFGDGATAIGNNPTHGYTSSGNFTVSLMVTNTNGCTSTASLVQTVNPTPAAIAGTLTVCTGSTTALTNSLPGTWSSSAPGTASVVPATGVVTGVAPGNATITFTSTAGCVITAVVTVNQTPSSVSVPSAVCVGNTITVSDAYLPGTGVWSSSNTALGTVNSSTGVVGGISAGSPVITYTIPATGCFNSASVVVNPLPAPIAGSLAVCIGLTSPLTDATPGGSWSSITGSVATISGGGSLLGISSGNSTISYTLGTGCASTAQATVNPNPAAITGTTTICSGFGTTLTSSSGTWSSSDITIATVTAGPSTTTSVSGISGGTATITVSFPTGCIATTSYLVNPTPAPITGTATVCVGSSTVLTDVTPGGTWTSSIPADVTITGSATITGNIAGTPNIIYTIPATACFVSTPFVVNALPSAITGGSAVCTGSTITLTSSAGGTWTSSNPIDASIGATTATTAVINGLTAGALTITYTLGTGCAVSEAFVVNQTPAAITGASSVCNGLNTTFTDATTGGVWSSSAPGTASVSVGGVVTGIAVGSTSINYTLGGVCSVTAPINVLAQPAVVTGASSVCTGATTTLSDATSGGTWTSNTPSMATIGATTATTAVINGVSAGVLAITYTLGDGCFSAWPFTVNQTPVAITGATVVCVASTITLSDISSGGTWSTSNGNASVGATTGVVTGLSAGSVNIIYTMPGGCFVVYAITVNGQPNISSFATAATSQCTTVTGTVTVTSASLGAGTFTVTYNLSGANTATANTATLTMGGGGSGTFTIPSGSLAVAGATTVTITQITNSNGCTIATPAGNTAGFNVYAYPTAYTVNGTGSYCAGGAGLHVFLSNSVAGVSYQMYYNGVATGSPITGIGASLDFGAQTAGGTYTIIGTNTTTLCATTMTGSAIITVNPLPTITVSGAGTICSGFSTTLTASGGSSYSWSPSTGLSATTGVIVTASPTSNTTYIVTGSNGTCSNTATAFVSVNPLPAAITGTASVCPGLTTTLASASAGGTWSSVNTAAATIGASSGVVTGVAAGTSTISYLLPTGCVITTIVTVNPNPAPIGGAGTVCTGSTMPLTDATTGGTWTSSGPEAIIVSGTGVVTGVSAGTPTMTYTMGSGCYATAQITVNSTPTAISGTLSTCPGQTTLLGSTPSGGTWSSSNPAYGSVVAATGLVTGISAGSPVISYTLAGCSATAVVVVNPNPGAIAGPTQVCQGSSVGLTDANPGGTWSSSSGTYVTMAGSVATGITAGTVTISYTLGTGCYATTGFTVNPVPAAITGTNTVCVGQVTNLGDAVTGGLYSSSNTALATVVAGTGVVTGVLAGSPTITYTLPTGCLTTYGVVVNPNPSAPTGTNNVCVGLLTTLTDPTTGGTWSSSNPANGSISVAGVVGGVAAGTTTISYTIAATGCFNTMLFTVNALPSAITGAPSVCVGSSTTLSSTPSGGSWTSSNPLWASVISGTGVVTGVLANVPNITYTLPTGCIAVTPIIVNPQPAVITGATTVCTGLNTTLADATTGGTWSSSNLTVGTVSATGVVTGIATGSVNISYTLPAGCFSVQPMTVNQQPVAIAGASTVCTGFTTTLADVSGISTWSSSATAVATVGAATGVVSGLTTGTVNITFTLPGGCYVLQPMTVNPTPAPIISVSNVCVSSNITMSDASVGGLWSSSDIGVATIGSTTGVLSGLTAGAINVTYTLPAGCIATFPLTVNPLPASILGTPTVCVLSASTITDASAGGIFTSSNPTLATISPTTGLITGVSAGTLVFTYTLPTACKATLPGTVYALPATFSVTGGGNYCTGGTGVSLGLTGSVLGNSYQVYYNNGVINVPLGTPWSGTGFALSFGPVTGGGVYTVQGIVNSTGCNALMSGSATVVINPLPATFTVTQTGTSYCAGSTGIPVGLTGSVSVPPTTYQLYNAGIASGAPVSGTGGVLPLGTLYTAGSYNVVATITSTGCTQAMTGVATVSVNPLPNVYSITGGGNYCTGGTGVNVGLSGSDAGLTYTLKAGALTAGTATGTGSSINFGLQTTAATYTVTALNTITGCTTGMLGTVAVATNPLPNAYNLTVSGTGAYCAGGAGLTLNLSNSQAGFSYQLYYNNGVTTVASGGPVTSTVAGAISFGARTGAGTYTATATNLATGCTQNMTGTPVISINPLPNIYTFYGGGPYCSGGTGVLDSLSGSQVGATYQLYLGGVALPGSLSGTGLPLASPLLTTGGIYTAVATLGSCTALMTGSATITVNSLPNAYIVSGTGNYCAGGTGVHVLLSNSDIGVNYQVIFGGSTPVTGAIAGTGAPLDFGAFFTAGNYTVVATNAATSCTKNMTGSATIGINPLPPVNNVTGGGSYCAGGTGVTIGLNGSVTGVSYQLYNGLSVAGAPLTGSGSALTFGTTFTAAGSYTVIATNSTTGCFNTMAGSTTVTITAPPAVNNVTGGGAYCAGGTGVHIGLDGSVGGNTYQLYNGAVSYGPAVTGTGSALDFGLITPGGTYTVTATTTATGCTGAMAGNAIITVNTLPTSYNVTGGGGYCAGGSGMHVYLSNSAVGINYQLYQGTFMVGAAIPGTGAILDFGLQTVAGSYTVVATNMTTSCTNNMSGSATISINALPTAYTVSGGGSYCSGGAGQHVLLSNSDLGNSYQLFDGTAPLTIMTGSGSGLDFGAQTMAGSYTVTATNTTTGCTASMTSSASITVTVLPTVYTVTGGGAYCATGTGVHVGLSSSDAGTSYQLYNGTSAAGSPLTGAGSSLDFGLQILPGAYTVVATSVASCINNMGGSVTVSVNPLPLHHTVTGGGSYCAGGTGAYIGLDGSHSGINYQLYNGTTAVGSPVPGTGLLLNFGLQTATGTYTVVAISSGTACTANMTGSATVSINSLPVVYSMTGGGNYCSGGAGVDVGLAGSDMGVNYQLYQGIVPLGGPVAGTGLPLDFGILSAAGIYTVTASNALSGCMSNMSGTSVININPLPATFNVTGGGSYCASTSSTLHAGLSGSQFGTSYQLMLGGVATGLPLAGIGYPLDFGVEAPAGTYTVQATTTGTGCMNTMTGSAVITINAAPVVYPVSGGGGYCIGGAGQHIFLDGSSSGINYQLYLGTIASGSPVAGTGSGLDFGLKTLAGAYTVVATDASTGCTSSMGGSATISINPLPSVFTVTGGGGYCAGEPGVHVMINGSEAGVNYHLYIAGSTPTGPVVAGTGLPIDMGVYPAVGTYTAIATNATTGCVNNMASSALISVNPLPLQYTVTGGGGYCSGGSGVAVGLSGSSTGISYLLYRGGIAVGTYVPGTGSAMSFGSQTDAGIYTVGAFNPGTGCSSAMITSVSVAVNALPAVYSVTGGGNFCAGGAGVPVSLSGSNSGISYQLYNGTMPAGTPLGGSGSSLSYGLKTSGGTYTVIATNSSTGCVSNMAGSAAVVVNALPVVYNMTGGGSYCAGGTGVNVTLSGSNTGINYQLYNTAAVGSAASGTGLLMNFGAQTISGSYFVVATNATTGCKDTMNGVTNVAVNAVPGIVAINGGGSYCEGGTGIAVGLVGSATGISYQLYTTAPLTATGSPVHGTGSSVSFGLQTEGSVYVAVATDTATGCTSNMSGTATVNVIPTVMPSVSILSSLGDTVCSGISVTYSAAPVNGGTSPGYQWSINGVTVGSGSSYTYLPVNGDTVSVTLTSSAACPAPATATDMLEMMVNANVMPIVSVTALTGDTICSGSIAAFSASSVYGGSAPAYSWILNSNPVATGTTYSYTPSNGDILFCKLTSNYQCVLSATAVSNYETMVVQPGGTAVVTVAVSYGTSAGPVVYNTGFTASVTNGGFSPSYQWLINGAVIAGATNATYTAPSLTSGDVVSCYVIVNSTCGTQSVEGSATVISANVGVQPVVNGSGDIRLSPNPNKGQFTISGNVGIAGESEYTLEITDLLGQVIYKTVVTAHNGQLNERVVLDNSVANGMYLLNLRSGNDNRVFHMVVEQ